MKCPYCDKEMTLGYIQSRDGVVWTPKNNGVFQLENGYWGYRFRIYKMVKRLTEEELLTKTENPSKQKSKHFQQEKKPF